MKTPFARLALAVAGLAAALLLVPAPAAEAQDLHPSRRPSPMGMARTTLTDGDASAYVRVVYSRPYKRDRDNIFGTEESGALVPFGKIWRTGANEATEITVTADVMVGGKKLPAGTYSVFTTPGAESWKVHFNSRLGLSGTGSFDTATQTFTELYTADEDVVTVSTAPKTLAEDDEVDQFTISFENKEGSTAEADMILRWITTEVRVPVALAG